MDFTEQGKLNRCVAREQQSCFQPDPLPNGHER